MHFYQLLKTTILFYIIMLLPTSFMAGNKGEHDFYSLRSSSGFIENKGQMTETGGKPANDVFFNATMPGLEILINKDGLSYIFLKAEKIKDEATGKKKKLFNYVRMDVKLQGASIYKEMLFAENASRNSNSYYYPHCPDGISNVRSYKKITARDVYPGIDWVIYFDGNNQLKYDFIVKPGANSSSIKLLYKGVDELQINSNSIVAKTAMGSITEGSIKSFTSQGTVASSFRVLSQNHVSKEALIGFDIERYNHKLPLTIDPPLQWATYFGGNGYDGPTSIVKDEFENIYVSGYVSSANFPVSDPGNGEYYQGTLPGTQSSFLIKFSNTGELLWSTYYGASTSSDKCEDMCIDKDGNIYLTGFTSANNYPLQDQGGGAYYQPAKAGSDDAFILKFDSYGVRKWCSYYGGAQSDRATAIATDSQGNVYMAGESSSPDFPLLSLGGAYNQTSTGSSDAFLIKFSAAGARLWATHLGGSSVDLIKDIAVAANNDVLVCGATGSTDFPVMDEGNGAYYKPTKGSSGLDAFAARFSGSGAMLMNTYFGGGKEDYAYKLNISPMGDIYFAGRTLSVDLPVKSSGSKAYYQATHSGGDGYDAFIAKLNSSDSLIWSTYLGGGGTFGDNADIAEAITTDNNGNVFVTGRTSSTSFPVIDEGYGGFYDGSYNGAAPTMFSSSSNVYVARFNSNDSLTWSTYYGGQGQDFATGIVTDTLGCIFVTGEWWSDNVSTLDPGDGAFYQATKNLTDEGFMLKFCRFALAGETTSTPVTCKLKKNGSVSAVANFGYPPYTYLWTPGNYTTSTVNWLDTGIYVVAITDAVGNVVHDTVIVGVDSSMYVYQNMLPSVSASIVGPDTVCAGTEMKILIASVENGTKPFTYNWNNGQGSASTFPVKPETTTTYPVIVTDSNKCQVSDSVTLFVRPAPTALFSVSDTVVCMGVQLQFADSSLLAGTDSIVSWAWNFYDGTTSNLADPTHAYSVSGTLTAELTVTSKTGCLHTYGKNIKVNPAPKALFDADSVCIGGTTIFTDASTFISGDYLTGWQWDFGDGQTASIQSPTHEYQMAGSYNVMLVTTSGKGNCNDTLRKTVQVFTLPQTGFIFSTACAGKQVIFTDQSSTSTGIITSWLWNFGNGDSSVMQYPSYVYDTAGSYLVTLKCTTTKGCSNTLSQLVKVNAIPQLSYAFQSVCPGDSTFFINHSSIATGDAITAWNWNFGDPYSSNTASTYHAAHVYDSSGTYLVTLVGTSKYGCKDTLVQTVKVFDNPQANFKVDNVCLGDSSILTSLALAKNDSIVSWKWYIDGAETDSGNIATLLPTLDKNYTICHKVITSNGCNDSACKTFTVYPLPVASYNMAKAVLCVNELGKFTDSSYTLAGKIVKWNWNFGDSGSSTLQNPSFIFSHTGIYPVTLTVTSSYGCTAAYADTIRVSGPKASFVPSIDSGLVPLTIVFNNTSEHAQSYLWTFDDGTSSSLVSPEHVYNAAGIYVVTLLVTDSTGCKDNAKAKIEVNLRSEIFVPNVFSPNNDGLNDLYNIEYIGIANVKGKIFDRWGVLVYEWNQLNTAWDGRDKQGKSCPEGTYFYVLDAWGYDGVTHSSQGFLTLMK